MLYITRKHHSPMVLKRLWKPNHLLKCSSKAGVAQGQLCLHPIGRDEMFHYEQWVNKPLMRGKWAGLGDCASWPSPMCKRSYLSFSQLTSISMSLVAIGQASSVREIDADSLTAEFCRSVISISKVSWTILVTLHEYLLTGSQCFLLSTKFVCRLVTQE